LNNVVILSLSTVDIYITLMSVVAVNI